MPKKKVNCCGLILFLLIVFSIQKTYAQSDSSTCKKGLSIDVAYFTEYKFEKKVYDNYSANLANRYIYDSVRFENLGRGMRFKLQWSNLFKNRLKNFGYTLAFCYSVDWSSAEIGNTIRTNANGSPVTFENSVTHQFSFISTVMYYYNQIQFSLGYQFPLRGRTLTTLSFIDGTQSLLNDRAFPDIYGYYFGILVPVAKKIAISGNFVRVPKLRIYPSFGVTYYFL
jgi:hypothetical protein